MKVYLIMAGNKYEGLTPICVCKTLEIAEEHLKKLNENDDFYGRDKNYGQYDSYAMGMEVVK